MHILEKDNRMKCFKALRERLAGKIVANNPKDWPDLDPNYWENQMAFWKAAREKSHDDFHKLLKIVRENRELNYLDPKWWEREHNRVSFNEKIEILRTLIDKQTKDQEIIIKEAIKEAIELTKKQSSIEMQDTAKKSELLERIIALRTVYYEKHHCSANTLIISNNNIPQLSLKLDPEIWRVYGMAVLITNRPDVLICTRIEESI